MAKGKKRHQLAGIPVDAYGGGTIDPTKNVLDLVRAQTIRSDDLRAAESRRIDELRAAESRRGEEQATLRADFEDKLRLAEAARLDSIRQVDREDVNKTAAQALNAIGTLATATTTTAETLRTQVATTAQAAATSLANSMSEVNKRLSALELSSSGGAGQSQGMRSLWAIIVAAAVVLFGFITTAIAVIAFLLARR